MPMPTQCSPHSLHDMDDIMVNEMISAWCFQLVLLPFQQGWFQRQLILRVSTCGLQEEHTYVRTYVHKILKTANSSQNGTLQRTHFDTSSIQWGIIMAIAIARRKVEYPQNAVSVSSSNVEKVNRQIRKMEALDRYLNFALDVPRIVAPFAGPALGISAVAAPVLS